MEDFRWSWGKVKPVSETDWRKEADYWFHRYLAVRYRVKHLTKMYRQARKLIIRLLQEK